MSMYVNKASHRQRNNNIVSMCNIAMKMVPKPIQQT